MHPLVTMPIIISGDSELNLFVKLCATRRTSSLETSIDRNIHWGMSEWKGLRLIESPLLRALLFQATFNHFWSLTSHELSAQWKQRNATIVNLKRSCFVTISKFSSIFQLMYLNGQQRTEFYFEISKLSLYAMYIMKTFVHVQNKIWNVFARKQAKNPVFQIVD